MKRKPVHPGVFFDRQIRDRLGMSKTEAAKRLGISRPTMTDFCKGESRCTPDMAKRLAIALDMNVAAWINMQANLDAWHAQNGIEELNAYVEKFPTEAA